MSCWGLRRQPECEFVAMKFLNLVLPGLLLAATGVGAGDLITSGLAGHHLGLFLWAAPLGALLKYTLTEGIARYQFATGEPLIHGWIKKLNPWIKWGFVFYLVVWSYMVGGALISACASALNAILPLQDGKYIYGTLQSIVAMAIVLPGNFKAFERIMGALVAVMFATVIGASFFFLDSPSALVQGLFSIKPSDLKDPWVLGVLGGVGGTLTILCYGYWLEENNRSGKEELRKTRIDLFLSYGLTALFSMAMMILGSKLSAFEGNGASFIQALANLFELKWGAWGKMIFLTGFWSGVFSSLLGVWQSVPYLFADLWRLHFKTEVKDLKASRPYRLYLVFLAVIPLSTLYVKFQSIQLLYALLGSLFVPLCALSLLMLNNRFIPETNLKNSPLVNIMLLMTLALFTYLALHQLF